MNATEISVIARNLFEAQGAKSIIEAAQKAAAFEKAGDEEQAKTWRRVETALLELRGPNAS